ncbi:restriction endonuclease subunit S [Lentiprolixibacter aurantiacus]|uniref:Restriction endonuclease subunit S n=1 Tax=Lentiprolixibacter aurantiacus TaxID=2993939 RepID=A0AAE3MKV9_9FLAO|nr:restriction endonuclease subunit S [Lentiprolixibacter aurantiacus]
MDRYFSYKDSGVEWIGEIPKDWKTSRVKEHFFERNEKVSDKDFPPLSVTRNGIVPQLDTVAKSDSHDNRKKVCKNDFVINSRSDRKGSSGLSSLEGSVSLINIVVSTDSINPEYSGFLFKSYEFIEEFFRNGKGIHWDLWSTRFTELQNIIIPIPPPDEQKEIVSFLDTKTSLIDSLIEKTQRKIELLKEQRTSLINEVVTKGLNPDVEMKYSGVEWIGEIPIHWDTIKLKYKGNVIIGLSYKPENQVDEKNGVLVMRSSNIQEGKPSFEDNVYVDCEIPEKLRTKEGDILICSRNGSRRLIGKNCLITEDLEKLTWGVFMTVYRSVSPKFFYWLLNSPIFESQSGLFLTSTINQLTVSTLQNMVVPYVDDEKEQQQIVEYLDKETELIDTTISKEEKRIELLKEYRQSLISEVVTGKIKVSGV